MSDADADAVNPSSNTRSYTLLSVLSSPGRSFVVHGESFRLMRDYENGYSAVECLVKEWLELLSVFKFKSSDNRHRLMTLTKGRYRLCTTEPPRQLKK